MSLSNNIGGYFGLELPNGHEGFHKGLKHLNSGRNALEYVLRTSKTRRLFIPKYACEAILQPIKKLSIESKFYTINEKLEIDSRIILEPEDKIIYINYFGIKNSYSDKLIEEYGSQLILDCSQAFYFIPRNDSDVFYSPRKFFGVSDGGLLYTQRSLNEFLTQDSSFDRMSHLIQRIDQGAEQGYQDFKNNEIKLNELPLMRMSAITEKILSGISYNEYRTIRNQNFSKLHHALEESNSLPINITDIDGPMVYPYMANDEHLRQKLIDNKVFVATYWPNVFEWTKEGDFERELTSKIIPLPIDQRYDEQDMARIIEVIK